MTSVAQAAARQGGMIGADGHRCGRAAGEGLEEGRDQTHSQIAPRLRSPPPRGSEEAREIRMLGVRLREQHGIPAFRVPVGPSSVLQEGPVEAERRVRRQGRDQAGLDLSVDGSAREEQERRQRIRHAGKAIAGERT